LNFRFDHTRVPLFAKLAKLPLGSITAQGWLKSQLERSAAGMGGHLDELEPDMIRDPYVTHPTREELDHRLEGRRQMMDLRPVRAGWYAEISGTYWTGLVQLAYTLPDPALIAKVEKWADAVLTHQEEGGYIGSYLPTDNRMEDYNAWGTNWVLRALFSYYEATGRQDVLEACHRGLLWFVENWKDYRTSYAGPTLIEGMIVGFTLTGDRRLLDWAEDYMTWLEKNSPWPNYPSSLSSDQFDYNSYHAVAYGEMVKYPALLYAVDGRADYLKASVRGVQKILEKGTQRTGAPSSNNEFLSPPGATYETEYCNFATFANSYAWMAMVTGDAAYGDLIEKIVFNGAQGARKKDEQAIAYMSSPNQMFATETSGIYNRCNTQAYAPVYYVACCPAKSVSIMPEYVREMCMTDADGGLYFMGYGPCSIATGGLRIVEDTHYPFSSSIHLTLHMDHPQSRQIHLRVPAWCGRAVIQVNGSTVNQEVTPGTFTTLDRLWQDGDVVDIDLEMAVKVVPVQCYDTPTAPLLAIERGPLLFSLPIKEAWTATKGAPLTPLPEGWSWYNVNPDVESITYEMHRRYDSLPWNYAVSDSLGQDSRIVSELKTGTGYPWETPPVVIRIPARKAKYASPPYPDKTIIPYLNPMPAGSPETMLELVPYGCTALRISYFVTAAPED
jgi:uncharacterized protein